MKVTVTATATNKGWERGDIIMLGDDGVYVYGLVVQSGVEVMLINLETGEPVVYMGTLMYVHKTHNINTLRELVEGATNLITHLSQDTYALKLAKLKED